MPCGRSSLGLCCGEGRSEGGYSVVALRFEVASERHPRFCCERSGCVAISAWIAEECNRVLGQEWTEAVEILYWDLVSAANGRERGAGNQFKVFKQFKEGAAYESVVDAL